MSPSRSRSKARPSPIVPANATATHSMPGATAATRSGSEGNVNEKTTTTSAAKNVTV